MTNGHKFVLEPVDTFFFPGHRPFNQDDPGLGEAEARFPPPPHVLAGCIRAAIARAQGWSEPWDDTAKALLGDGPFDTGGSTFGPPLIVRRDGTVDSVFFPAPAALFGHFTPKWPGEELEEVRLLVPCTGEAIESDADRLQSPRLPRSKDGAWRSLDGWWIRRNQLKHLLKDGSCTTEGLVAPSEIWRQRARVGVETDRVSHRAKDSMLYSVAFGQLAGETVGFGVAADLPKQAPAPPAGSLVPLGGRGRGTALGETGAALSTKVTPATLKVVDGLVHYMVILVSPAFLGGGPVPDEIDALPGTLVGAVHERPSMLGAWHHAAPEDRRYTRLHPAGSTWFFTSTEKPRALHAALEKIRKTGLGAHCKAGFGALVFGRWNPCTGETR
ncbi:MAG: hypothetical protein KDE35_18790 [Geminicoccaceae bacterium]|nr:hypothetical protein [Geminicoccaceae bacterium]